MEEILNKILKELQYQTKLLETVVEKKDDHRHGNQQLQKNMESLIDNLSAMPGMNTPQAQEMLKNIMNIIPK